MDYNVAYTSNKHGYVTIKNNKLFVKIPSRLKNNKKFQQDLLEKGAKLLQRSSTMYCRRRGDYIWMFGEQVSIQELSIDRLQTTSFLRDTLMEYCLPLLDKFSKELGYSYRKLYVKPLRSKRGSCSSKQNISLNLDLVHLPSKFAYYVTIHELCHLKHKNHSARFWQEVERLFPKYKLVRKEMRKIKFFEE